MKVCITTEPKNLWIGDLIEDCGDFLVVEDENGIARDIPIYDCEILDKETE
jgi:hypothetical protein